MIDPQWHEHQVQQLVAEYSTRPSCWLERVQATLRSEIAIGARNEAFRVAKLEAIYQVLTDRAQPLAEAL